MKTAALLRRWAALGRSVSALVPNVDWSPATKMIRAAERDAAASQEILDRLVARSGRDQFLRLGDPLDRGVNFGAHRWLRDSREEAWSDWLAWILQRNTDSRQVLKLFGVKPRLVPSGCCEIERERSTQNGRLDLVLYFGDTTLVIEVKTASQVGDDQLGRYGAWLQKARAPLGRVLLAIDEPENLKTGWQFCSWEAVSMELRTWAAAWLRNRRVIEAALTLAFCGAVEQNILGFGSRLNAPRATRYLETWLGRGKDEKRKP
jgi:hypothetical protein